MTTLIPPDHLLTFLSAALLITFAPGPDNLMVLGQSLSRGKMAGFGITLGCALGCFTHTIWFTLGLSALVVMYPPAFFILKLIGAVYLAWLGIKALRSNGRLNINMTDSLPLPWYRFVIRGFIANAVNPKVALFFISFLSQFINEPAGHVGWQGLILGTIFACQTVIVFSCFAFAAGAIGNLLARRPRMGLWLDRLTGTIFIGLAVYLLFSGRPQTSPLHITEST